MAARIIAILPGDQTGVTPFCMSPLDLAAGRIGERAFLVVMRRLREEAALQAVGRGRGTRSMRPTHT